MQRCDTCEFETGNPSNYKKHLKTKKHLLLSAGKPTRKQYSCEVCGDLYKPTIFKVNYERHVLTKKHRNRAAEVAALPDFLAGGEPDIEGDIYRIIKVLDHKMPNQAIWLQSGDGWEVTTEIMILCQDRDPDGNWHNEARGTYWMEISAASYLEFESERRLLLTYAMRHGLDLSCLRYNRNVVEIVAHYIEGEPLPGGPYSSKVADETTYLVILKSGNEDLRWHPSRDSLEEIELFRRYRAEHDL